MKATLKTKISFTIIFVSLIFSTASLPRKTYAQVLAGGRFLPGLFDIFTPSPTCGLLVSVVGPRPGLFVWAPTRYNFFNMTLNHVGTHVLGKSVIAPPCPPTLILYGSSLIP